MIVRVIKRGEEYRQCTATLCYKGTTNDNQKGPAIERNGNLGHHYQIGIALLSGVSLVTIAIIIGIQFESGLITKDNFTPVSNIPGGICTTPLQTGLSAYRDQ